MKELLARLHRGDDCARANVVPRCTCQSVRVARSSRAEVHAVAFSIVDVFAPRPLAGNPAAIVPDADDLRLENMRALAREVNQSETVFIVAADDDRADWQLRSFTPIGAEVGGAQPTAPPW